MTKRGGVVRSACRTHNPAVCGSNPHPAIILFHGTGARRRQSIRKNGLLPKPDSYVYASLNPMIADVFATARGELEHDYGLIVKFKASTPWENDPLFPESLRCPNPVPPADILSLKTLDPAKEIDAHNWLAVLVKTIRLAEDKIYGKGIT